MLHNTARRWAVGGVATALAATALVSTTATTAEAGAGVTGNYSCTITAGDPPVVTDYALPITITPGPIPSPAPAGYPAPAGLIPVTMTSVIPADLAGLFGALSVDSITSKDLAMTMGSTKIPVKGLALTGFTVNPDGTGNLSAAGTNGKFTTPAAGDYDVKMPKSFTLLPSSGATDYPPIVCTTGKPKTLTAVTLVKQGSKTVASLDKGKIHAGKPAVVNAKVTRDYGTAAGTVKVLKKGNVIGKGKLNNKGKVSIKTDQFKKTGKYTLTVKYVGDGYAVASQDKVTLKVVK